MNILLDREYYFNNVLLKFVFRIECLIDKFKINYKTYMIIKNENMMAKIAINKSLLKEYQVDNDSRVVYMNDGDEFQIQLFNPEKFIVGCEITINGTNLNGLLILKPGERIWLERYLNESKKFRFSIYNVEENNEQVKKAIADNGNIEIKFYKEKEEIKYQPLWQQPYDMNHKLFEQPLINDPNKISPFIYKDVNHTTCINDNSIVNTTYNNCLSGVQTCASIINLDDNGLYCKTYDTINDIIKRQNNKLFETGRIEKGNNSNQNIKTVNNYSFESYWFKKEDIKILPMSRKPYTSNDLNKVYCTNCGRKINTKFKFCPYCGTKVQR